MKMKGYEFVKEYVENLCLETGIKKGYPTFIVGNEAASLKFAALQNTGWLWDWVKNKPFGA